MAKGITGITGSRRDFIRGIAVAGAAGAAGARELLRSDVVRAAAGPAGGPGGSASAAGASAPAGAGGRKLGVAIVGIGKLSGGQLIPALRRTRSCRLAALVSGHPDKAKKVAAENGLSEKNIYSYETYDRLRDDPSVDIVYVVLPNSMHAEYTIRAAAAGKHVYCEKPMAVSVKECEEMIAACKKAGRMLGIAYRLHFEPHNLEVARLARARELGAVKVIDVAACTMVGDPRQWRLDKKLSGGGSMVDIGIYGLQAARMIAGEEPVSVSARQTITDPIKFKGIDETLLYSMTFPSGVVANGISSYAVFLNRWTVAAERGRFGLDPALNYRGIKGFRSDDKPLTFPEVEQFALEMDDFAECVRDNRPTKVPGEEGLRDVRIMEAMYRSAETGREMKL